MAAPWDDASDPEAGRWDGTPEEPDLWELFHENSKLSPDDQLPLGGYIRRVMGEMTESFHFDSGPRIPLPEPSRVSAPLEQVVTSRVSARAMVRRPIPLADLSSLLRLSYGVTRRNTDGRSLRSFRVAPSGGALYPLEIFFHTSCVDGLPPGVYHFDPLDESVCCVNPGDHTPEIGEGFVYRDVAEQASVIFFITSVFDRTTFKYGDRGYRFALLEAGHVAQNMNLVGVALGHGVLNIGGYLDRAIDALLNIDGVTHSTVYVVAVGKAGPTNGS